MWGPEAVGTLLGLTWLSTLGRSLASLATAPPRSPGSARPGLCPRPSVTAPSPAVPGSWMALNAAPSQAMFLHLAPELKPYKADGHPLLLFLSRWGAEIALPSCSRPLPWLRAPPVGTGCGQASGLVSAGWCRGGDRQGDGTCMEPRGGTGLAGALKAVPQFSHPFPSPLSGHFVH